MRSPREPYYTRYAAQAIRNEVLQRYPVADPVSVDYFCFGLHDNYRVRSADGDYILRLYRFDWRNRPLKTNAT